MNLKAIEAARFTCMGETLAFKVAQYANNGRTAIQIVVADTGEPWATLTVNMPQSNIPYGFVAIKDYSENVEVAKAAYATGLFEDTRITAEGMPVWKIK